MNKLKEKRIENRYKLKDIAEVAGVSFQAVQQWETGETMPSVGSLVKLSRFYGCTIEDLLDPEEIMSEINAEMDAEMQDLGLIDDDTEMIDPEECF